MMRVFRFHNPTQRRACVLLSCALILSAMSSCSLFKETSQLGIDDTPESVLLTRQTREDVIAVDFYRISVRYEQRQLLEDFWNDGSTTDQVIPIELKRRLADAGIRIGVQGRAKSPTLACLLDLDAVRADEAIGKIREQTTQIDPSLNPGEKNMHEVLLEPLIYYKVLPLSALPGISWSVYTYDDLTPKMTLFWEQGGWCGQTYNNAQGMIDLSALALPESSAVRFDLLPVFEYGESKQRLKKINGAAIKDSTRDRLIYDSLKMSIKLLPGHWLVVGPTSENPPGIGRHLFTRTHGQTEQRIMVFRLASKNE